MESLPTTTSNRSGRMEPNRTLRMSTRNNAMYKWKHDPTVIGALELNMELGWQPDARLTPMEIPTTEQQFQECLQIWKQQKLRKTLMEALSQIPPVRKCCGLIPDPEQTIRAVVPLLNHGWAKKLNNSDFLVEKGYSIDAFVWSWSHVSGAAETVRLMIRFHSGGGMSKRNGVGSMIDW